MHVVTLSQQAQAHMAGQIADCHRTGRGFMSVYPLIAGDETVADVATVMVIPHAADTSVSVSLFGSSLHTCIHSVELNEERLGDLLNLQANAALERGCYPLELMACSDLAYALKFAVRLQGGVFLLPTALSADLYLVLESSLLTCDRVSFRFVADGELDTMPARLPSSEAAAFELLLAVALDIIARSQGRTA